MDWTQIIIALIPAITSIITVVITSRTNKKVSENIIESKLSDIRTQIMLLILDDRVSIMEGKLPENRKDIDELFDRYTKLGGNSHIKRKYQQYCQLVDMYESKHKGA